jgi:uncharacterized protein (TIGR00255 family)
MALPNNRNLNGKVRMLVSMTGHGQATRPFESGTVTVELRSVNNRFLKISSRVDQLASIIEPEIESIVRQQVRRGSLNVSIDIASLTAASPVSIDSQVLADYLSKASAACEQSGWNGPVGDFLSLPGVIVSGDQHQRPGRDVDDRRLHDLRECLQAAVSDLQSMRIKEGQAMAVQFGQTLDEFERLMEVIKEGVDRQTLEYGNRLESKLRKSLDLLGVKYETIDIVREVTIFADRSDISEEILRFDSHIQQMRALIHSEESPGRKMEFLIQELHREVNTMGSKSYDATIAGTVVEIKTRIEQLRELVQNVE